MIRVSYRDGGGGRGGIGIPPPTHTHSHTHTHTHTHAHTHRISTIVVIITYKQGIMDTVWFFDPEFAAESIPEDLNSNFFFLGEDTQTLQYSILIHVIPYPQTSSNTIFCQILQTVCFACCLLYVLQFTIPWKAPPQAKNPIRNLDDFEIQRLLLNDFFQ